MVDTLNTDAIIKAIEEYRAAYWEYRDPKFVKEKRYKPLIGHIFSKNAGKGNSFTVVLYDTWVDIARPGHFCLGREPVAGAEFTHTNLQLALETLLNFTRVQFMDDKLFNSIKA